MIFEQVPKVRKQTIQVSEGQYFQKERAGSVRPLKQENALLLGRIARVQ